jgi:hypothetical protein
MKKIEKVTCGKCGHVFYRTQWTPCPRCFRPGSVFYTGERVEIENCISENDLAELSSQNNDRDSE